MPKYHQVVAVSIVDSYTVMSQMRGPSYGYAYAYNTADLPVIVNADAAGGRTSTHEIICPAAPPTSDTLTSTYTIKLDNMIISKLVCCTRIFHEFFLPSQTFSV